MLVRMLAALIAATTASAAAAESADYYRGGWRTEAGEPKVYQFVIRGSQRLASWSMRFKSATRSWVATSATVCSSG